MKKRAMKKYIPYGFYCYGRIAGQSKDGSTLYTTGKCKNMVYSHTVDDFMVVPKELGSRDKVEIPCKIVVHRCKYTGINTMDDALLHDYVKICGIKEPRD